MSGRQVYIVAGDPSGDLLAAGVVRAWREREPDIRFTGAGGPQLAAAGMEVGTDLTHHAVIGLWEVVRRYWTFRRLFHRLLEECVAQRPSVLLCVDYGGFNLRFAEAVRERSLSIPGWRPHIVQLVSPQVWASRPQRARTLEQTHDLLLSILPFEKAWYADHVPRLRVEHIGHPLVDRLEGVDRTPLPSDPPELLLLPGSRTGELQRHLPVQFEAARRLRSRVSVRLVLPAERLCGLARELGAGRDGMPEPQVGDLAGALRRASVAIASTGTVTLECAWFGVPTLAMYRTSWLTYQIGRRLITVRHLAMPNLLSDGAAMPEFIQEAATGEALAAAAEVWLDQPMERLRVHEKLLETVRTLGTPGAGRRAAEILAALV